MKHEYIRKDDRKPFTAIQWTGNNFHDVYAWAQASSKKKSYGVSTTHYMHLGNALLVHIDDRETSVGDGAWLVWRDSSLVGWSDAAFRQQFVPVSVDGIGGIACGVDGRERIVPATPSDEEQQRQAKRAAERTRYAETNSQVLRPQATVTDASQGSVARDFCEEEAKPAYIVRTVRNFTELELMLNKHAKDGYKYADYGWTRHPDEMFVLLRKDCLL